MFRCYYLFILIVILTMEYTHGEDENKSRFPKSVGSYHKEISGFNIKISPALFWKTVVVELEYPISKTLSIGVNLFGKLGKTDGNGVSHNYKDEDFLHGGLGGEAAVKYYFKKEAPDGFYIQANAGYTNIQYFDGNTRPYVMHNHWKKKGDDTYANPQPFYAGAGVGYQLVFIPDHFIGNLMVGVQANAYPGYFPLSLYLAPSLGYKF